MFLNLVLQNHRPLKASPMKRRQPEFLLRAENGAILHPSWSFATSKLAFVEFSPAFSHLNQLCSQLPRSSLAFAARRLAPTHYGNSVQITVRPGNFHLPEIDYHF